MLSISFCLCTLDCALHLYLLSLKNDPSLIQVLSAARELGIKNGEKEIACNMRRRVRRGVNSCDLSVCSSVGTLSPPSSFDLASSSFQGMLGAYMAVHSYNMSGIC